MNATASNPQLTLGLDYAAITDVTWLRFGKSHNLGENFTILNRGASDEASKW